MGMVKISKTRPETKCDDEAAEKLKPRQRIRNRASKPKTKLSLQNPTVSGMTCAGVFEARF
jgi:hypothetical protein